jgi:hypothetical protein
LNEDRLQPYNLVQGGRRFCFNRTFEEDQREISTKLENPVARRHYSPHEDEYPNGVASSNNLGGLSVHCFGRTTGLQGGMVGSTMSSVRIYRRKTFSRSWHVAGGFGGMSNPVQEPRGFIGPCYPTHCPPIGVLQRWPEPPG